MAVLNEKKTEDFLGSFHTVARSGVKKAAEAVSAMSASAIRLDVISAGVAPTALLSEVTGNPEDLVVGVYITVSGDIPGHALLVLPYESALHLVDMIAGNQVGSAKRLGEMEESVIQEIGNIVTSAYLNALSDFYQCTLLPSPPGLAIDMAADVIDSVLLNTGRFDGGAISIITRFAGVRRSLRGFFLYIPEISTSL